MLQRYITKFYVFSSNYFVQPSFMQVYEKCGKLR